MFKYFNKFQVCLLLFSLLFMNTALKAMELLDEEKGEKTPLVLQYKALEDQIKILEDLKKAQEIEFIEKKKKLREEFKQNLKQNLTETLQDVFNINTIDSENTEDFCVCCTCKCQIQ